MFSFLYKIDISEYQSNSYVARERLAMVFINNNNDVQKNKDLEAKIARFSSDVFNLYEKGELELAKIKV